MHLQSSSPLPHTFFFLLPFFFPLVLLLYEISAQSGLTPKIWLLPLLPLTQKPKAFYKSSSIFPRKSLLFMSALSLATSNRFSYWVLFSTQFIKGLFADNTRQVPLSFWKQSSFHQKANSPKKALVHLHSPLYLLLLGTGKNSGRLLEIQKWAPMASYILLICN